MALKTWPSARGTEPIQNAGLVAPAGVPAVADAHADSADRAVAEDGVEDAGVGRAEPELPEPTVRCVVRPADPGMSLSGSGLIQFPASRMFGQSAPWAQPGRSHQSQTFGVYCRDETAFSATASVFEVPSGMLDGLDGAELHATVRDCPDAWPPLMMIPPNACAVFGSGAALVCHDSAVEPLDHHAGVVVHGVDRAPRRDFGLPRDHRGKGR